MGKKLTLQEKLERKHFRQPNALLYRTIMGVYYAMFK